MDSFIPIKVYEINTKQTLVDYKCVPNQMYESHDDGIDDDDLYLKRTYLIDS